MLTTLLVGLSMLTGVSKVENGGLLFTDNQAGVSGTDAGYSLPIGSDTLWMFGDVFLLDPTSPSKNYIGGVSNCGLIVHTRPGSDSLKTYRFLTDPARLVARPLLPNTSDEDNHTRLWPYGSWYDPAKRRAYLFYGNIKTTGTGAFDFKPAGYGLAEADTSNPDTIQFHRLKSATGDELWWRGDAPAQYGAAVVSGNTDGYIYIVGCNEREGIKKARLARVRRESVEDQKAYSYLTSSPASSSSSSLSSSSLSSSSLPSSSLSPSVSTGNAQPTWDSDPIKACNLDGLTDFPTELSVAFNPYLGGYLAVQSVGVSDHLRLSLAKDPWGPYKQIAEIGAPHQAFAKSFCYAGKEHQELAQQGGRIIYVTYVDSQRYWLQLLKITLEK